jgi:spermidine/putrescine transport system substrate-binding protein
MRLHAPTGRRTALLISLVFLAVACSKGSGSSSSTVSLLTYQNSLLPDVTSGFGKANPSIKLDANTFTSEDDAIAKLQAGAKTDVVYACLTDTDRLASAKLVQPIDTGKLTAWKTLFPYFRDSSQIAVGDKIYVIPVFGGTTGLIYNPNELPDGVNSFKQLLEDPNLAGKVAIEDNAKYGIAMGALALGYQDPFNLTDADLAKVKRWYLDHISQIRAFYTSQSEFSDLYTKGDVVAGFGYKGYDVGLAKQSVPVAFQPASEGALTWTCGYAIGANAQNLDGAYALLNWFLTPEAQTAYATSLDQMPTNQASLDSMPGSLADDVGLKDGASSFDNSIPTQIPANYDRWQQVWQQITSA